MANKDELAKDILELNESAITDGLSKSDLEAMLNKLMGVDKVEKDVPKLPYWKTRGK